MNRPTYIYALCCPDTGDVRYIGKADNPRTRLGGHLSDAKRPGMKPSHKNNWLRKVLSEGKTSKLIIVEEVTVENWADREKHWISYYRTTGRLTNVADGGESCLVDGKHPMLGTKKSFEFCKNLSIKRTGSGNPMYGRPAPNRGIPHTPETRAKVGHPGEKNGNYGKPAWNRGKPTPEHVRKKQGSHGEKNPMFGKTGELAPCFGRTGEKHPMYGKHHTDESKEKIRKALSGKIRGPYKKANK